MLQSPDKGQGHMRRFWAPLTTYVLFLEVVAALGWIIFAAGVVSHRSDVSRELFPDNYFLTDFYTYKGCFANYHLAAFFQDHSDLPRFAYPPLLAPVYEVFYTVPHRTSVFLLCTVAIWAALAFWACKVLAFRSRPGPQRVALIGSLTFVYPAVFLLQRGNLELFVWASVALALYFYAQGRLGPFALAAGAAAACKLYPILLLGLLLHRRSLRFLALGLVTSAGLTALALSYSGPSFGVAARGFAAGVGGFQRNYAGMLRVGELRFDHSLFSVVKRVAVSGGRDFRIYSRPYYVACAIFFGLLYILGVRRRSWQNHVVFLSACMILLPPVSYDYTLVHLYVPTLLLAAILSSERAGTRLGRCAFLCLLLLMLPLSLYPQTHVILAGQLQALLLAAVAVLSAFPFFLPETGRSGEASAQLYKGDHDVAREVFTVARTS